MVEFALIVVVILVCVMIALGAVGRGVGGATQGVNAGLQGQPVASTDFQAYQAGTTSLSQPPGSTPAPYSAGSGYRNVILADHPVGYWQLDDATSTVKDYSGNNIPLTANPGVSFQGSSIVAGVPSMSLAGNTSSYVGSGGVIPSQLNIPGPVTLEIWVKINNVAACTCDMLRESGNTQYGMIVNPDGSVAFHWYDGAWKSAGGGSGSVASGQTVYLALTKDSANNVLVYINGKVVAEVAASNPATPSGEFVIGGMNYGQDTPGLVSNAAIYSTNLSSTQIAKHYAAGMGTSLSVGYSGTVLADGPLGYWRLDDTGSTANDLSGHGNNGSIAGGVTKGVAGATKDGDAALQLTAGGSNVSMMSGVSISTPFSVEGWMIAPTGGGDNRIIGRNWVGTQDGWLLDYYGSPYPFFGISQGPTQYNAGVTYYPTVNQWHHFVGTYDGTTVKLYIDGSLAASNAQSGLTTSFTGGVVIGGVNANAPSVDEVAVYPYALTPAQVSTHYHLGCGC